MTVSATRGRRSSPTGKTLVGAWPHCCPPPGRTAGRAGLPREACRWPPRWPAPWRAARRHRGPQTWPSVPGRARIRGHWRGWRSPARLRPDPSGGLTERDIAQVEALERRELTRRVERYRDGRPPIAIEGRTVVIVDDGLATGATARTAVHIARARGAVTSSWRCPWPPRRRSRNSRLRSTRS